MKIETRLLKAIKDIKELAYFPHEIIFNLNDWTEFLNETNPMLKYMSNPENLSTNNAPDNFMGIKIRISDFSIRSYISYKLENKDFPIRIIGYKYFGRVIK